MRTRTRTCRLNVEVLEDRCTPSTFAAFDLANPQSGPFPSDRFTVADASQLTGRRVDLPLPVLEVVSPSLTRKTVLLFTVVTSMGPLNATDRRGCRLKPSSVLMTLMSS